MKAKKACLDQVEKLGAIFDIVWGMWYNGGVHRVYIKCTHRVKMEAFMGEKRVTVKVPEDLHKKAKKKAKEKDVTVSQVVRRALREFTKDADSPEDA